MNTGIGSKFDLNSSQIASSTERSKFSFSEAMRELMFYVLPILSFSFFLLLVLTAVVPNLNTTLSDLDQLDKLVQNDSRLKTRIENISELQKEDSSYQEIIKKIDSIVPVGKTEVVKFSSRITDTIISNGLKASEIKTGEVEYAQLLTMPTEEDNKDVVEEGIEESQEYLQRNMLKVRQIPLEFSVEGSFGNIRNFFSDLYKGNDFFVVEKMDLSLNYRGADSEQDRWVGNIILVKYQFVPPRDFNPEKAYASITEENELDPSVVEFLNNKFVDDLMQE